ncbi:MULTISPECIES: serine/threonine protein kinase [Oceanobacillus]|uniref:non-specific serine/threonine protein kinase n=1 Tax=Oceanobacillus profundus TaxID=372463 RepID=A0A417YJE0_9BACI|nr:serine/threonine-protein kinase [Oceanobacillus profundus]MBR3118340.1 serine/threonine protein kinase [Oceanobacillus sp.]PAE31111.1 hypothetical protein CHI07_00860 [Paenibacillus sp. 7884-2]RHW33102.1 serine/threonine protein kinase [Oceanobacillus profundus]
MNKHNIHIKKGDILNGKYHVLSHIASGGMSEVYLVEEVNDTNRRWAVKITNMESKLASKLIDETKLLSELEHSNLPRVIDFFSTENYFFLVQEYIDAVSLSDYFQLYNNQLSVDTIIKIGVQLCDVLHYLHTQKPFPIVYRDIKPGNIMINKDREIKLIDFGIARKFQHNRMKDTVQVGTVGFAAPEQFEKKQTDTRTDLFSLGALLYYLLSQGKYVYIVQKPIKKLHKRLPKSLDRCVTQLVELQPEDRLQDAREAKILMLKAKEEWENKRSQKWDWSIIRPISIVSISIVLIGYIIISFI